MSLEHALTGEIRKLKGQLGGMVREVDQYRQTMENAQAGLARAEEALTNHRALISYLEMSLEDCQPDPSKWKVGDRFKWGQYSKESGGEVTYLHNNHVTVRTDAGGVIGMSFDEFERRAAKP